MSERAPTQTKNRQTLPILFLAGVLVLVVGSGIAWLMFRTIELPKDFPAGMPIHPTMKARSAKVTPASTTVHFVTSSPLHEIISFYGKATKANGWTLSESTVNPGNGGPGNFMYFGSFGTSSPLEGKNTFVRISGEGSDGGCVVSINYEHPNR